MDDRYLELTQIAGSAALALSVNCTYALLDEGLMKPPRAEMAARVIRQMLERMLALEPPPSDPDLDLLRGILARLDRAREPTPER